MKTLHLYILIALTLTSCAAPQELPQTAHLTPLPIEQTEPDNQALKERLQKFLRHVKAPAASTYDFIRTDLDNDGRRDALILFKSPYGYWCGLHGCTMLVLKASNTDFTLVNAIQPIREPLYISEDKSNGWKNLVTRVSGRTDKAKDVIMRFDGQHYPNTPDSLPPQNTIENSSLTPAFKK